MPQLSIRARYANGVLIPLEPIDLSEGREVSVDISVDEENDEAPSLTEVGNPRVLEIVDELRSEYPDAFSSIPHDGGKYYKHYLYGHPRDED